MPLSLGRPRLSTNNSTTLAHPCDCLSGTNVRLLVVGGAGSLYVSPKHTLAVSDTPDFPDTFKPLAAAMAKALGKLRERSNVKWTYISPAGYFRAEGKRTYRALHLGRRRADPGRCW